LNYGSLDFAILVSELRNLQNIFRFLSALS